MKGFDQLVEARIREAAARGDLDNLPGAGKPLPLDDLAGLSHDERVEALLLRSVGAPPEEVRLLREIAEHREALARDPPPEEKARLVKSLRDKSLRLSILFEKGGRFVLANEALRFMP
jgi:hypothetical protein